MKNVQFNPRISPETKLEMDRFCHDNNCTQAEAVDLLLALNRLKDAEARNPQRKELLSSFRHHIESLFALQEASIAMAESSKAAAREDFSAQLDQNSELIHTLQNAIKDRDMELSTLRDALSASTEERDRAIQKAADCGTLCSMLQMQLQEREEKILDLENALTQTKDLPRRYQELLEKFTELQQQFNALSEERTNAALAHMDELRRIEAEKHQLELEVTRLSGGR